jgi:hypothetical protein
MTTEQSFYEHIARNYEDIRKYALKYIKKLTKNKYAWNKKKECWYPDFDEWDGYDDITDLNFWVNEEENGKTEIVVTAYLYTDSLQSSTYVNIINKVGA